MLPQAFFVDIARDSRNNKKTKYDRTTTERKIIDFYTLLAEFMSIL